MRIVSYARVSTLGQESEGESLDNQERAFQQYIARSGADRIASYREAKSAKNIAGRAEFSRMIADLAVTKPDCIVVDTLDRFTRNLREGLNTLEQLRGHHVGLLPLDWQRREPIDLDDDSDWSQVVEEFKAAERERRRIRKRMKRSYEGRRERGATTTNRPAFGLRKNGDRLEPDPQTVWIVTQAEERALRGEDFLAILRWARDLHPRAWGAAHSLNDTFANRAYVVAGARSLDRQAALDDLLALRASRFGQRRIHENEFTGVFLCGHCADDGHRSLMVGTWRKDGRARGYRYPVLVCGSTAEDRMTERRHHFSVAQNRFEQRWWRYVDILTASPALLERWASAGAQDGQDRVRGLTARLAGIDQKAAALKARRDRALDLLSDRSAAVVRQAKKALEDVERDEMELALARQTVLGELAAAPSRERDPQAMKALLARYAEVYQAAPIRTRNELNRALCAEIGSHPKLYRFGRFDDPLIDWPELDALRKVKTR